ncbi:hypothetical protein LCGC14_0972470 [marine sediment metagenome]|uniref:Terminase large subunit gp17-like C-terminal domain-containing protein n=1 Tax=marine sediment metagenome TaxID=412755 RepID=A0A0F9NBC2_9ZZZZ
METKEIVKEALKTRRGRKAYARRSLAHFTYIYLGHYIKYDTPDFHLEIYKDLGRTDIDFLELLAFRGSAKSTIASLALALWSAVTDRKNFIIILSDTFAQAKMHIQNIIYELENNELLIRDFGPFKLKEEWTSTNIILAVGVRILSRSRGQRIRGLRHKQYRPDLIVGDDLENNELVRTKEQRDKTSEWWNGEVIPAIDTDKGMVVLIGSLLHSDSLMARQKALILKEGIGVLKEYPIMREDGEILWHQRYTKEDIEKLRIRVGTRYFQREYLLKLVPEDGQVIKKVHYYQKLPKIKAISIGVDLAISQKETADYTAINVIGKGEDNNFYNLRNIAGRWNFNTTLTKVNDTYKDYRGAHAGIPLYLGIEDVAYQHSAIEEYHRRFGIKPKAVKVSKDKRARLEAIEPYFVSEQVFFREEGDEDVVTEILNFGIEAHDDRMDAFEISLSQLLDMAQPNIRLL